MGNLKSTKTNTTRYTTNLSKFIPCRNIIFKNCIVWNCTCCQQLQFNETKINRQHRAHWQWTNQHTNSVLFAMQNTLHSHTDTFPLELINIIKSLSINDPNTIQTKNKICTEFRLNSLTSLITYPICHKWYTSHGHKKLWSDNTSLNITFVGNAGHILDAFSQSFELPELQPRHFKSNQIRRTFILDNKYPIRVDLTTISMENYQINHSDNIRIIYFESMNDLLSVEKLCNEMCLKYGHINNHILFGNDIYKKINHKKVNIFCKSLNIPYINNKNFNAFQLITFAIKYFWISDTFYNYSHNVIH